MKFEWEQIDFYHRRAKVVGGWLVKAHEDVWEAVDNDGGRDSGYNWRVAMTFVPDANHSWEITK